MKGPTNTTTTKLDVEGTGSRPRRRRLSVSHVQDESSSPSGHSDKIPPSGRSQAGTESRGATDHTDRGYVKQVVDVTNDEMEAALSARAYSNSNPQSSTVMASPPKPRQSTRRLSVSGRVTEFGQQEFSNKEVSVKSSKEDFCQLNDLVSLGIAYACHKGMKPESPNQDDFFIIKIDNWGLYGVFDGHGPFGHDISNFVQREFPKTLYSPLFLEAKACNMPNLFKTAFQEVESKLEDNYGDATSSHHPNCQLSGSTGSIVYHRFKEGKLFIAHVGDSRVVLARRTDRGLVGINLTEDHKPELPAEKSRIESCGGAVIQQPGDIPHRVFKANQVYPGLAMSRAFGDLVAREVGVCSEPDVNDYTIQPDDEFLMIASDGIWEFISSQEAVEMVAGFSRADVKKACEHVCQVAWDRWIEEEHNIVDDITLEIIYLKE